MHVRRGVVPAGGWPTLAGFRADSRACGGLGPERFLFWEVGTLAGSVSEVGHPPRSRGSLRERV